jgi:hypothetical protein
LSDDEIRATGRCEIAVEGDGPAVEI